MVISPNEVIVRRYGRYWAVYLDSELLALVVYKKGALSIKRLLDQIFFHVDSRAGQ